MKVFSGEKRSLTDARGLQKRIQVLWREPREIGARHAGEIENRPPAYRLPHGPGCHFPISTRCSRPHSDPCVRDDIFDGNASPGLYRISPVASASNRDKRRCIPATSFGVRPHDRHAAQHSPLDPEFAETVIWAQDVSLSPFLRERCRRSGGRCYTG